MEGKLDESSDDKGGLFGLKNPFDWVVLAAIVVFVFLILLIICLYCCRQHKKKGKSVNQYSSGSSYFNKTFCGMRIVMRTVWWVGCAEPSLCTEI